MQRISFQATLTQFRQRTQTVTRRLSFRHAKPGQVLLAVEQLRGIPRGQHQKPLGQIRLITVRTEPILKIMEEPYGTAEVRAEGFPDVTPCQFVQFFTDLNNCPATVDVVRLEFEYIDPPNPKETEPDAKQRHP